MNLRYFVILLVLIGSSGLIISSASGAYVEFDNGEDKLLVNNNHIVDFKLNWNSKNYPSGKITFDEPIHDTILLQIPKNIPRITNLDFGSSLYAIQTDGSWEEIKETESDCFYILEIPVNDSDHIEIESASVATGRWESVSIENNSYNDLYDELIRESESIPDSESLNKKWGELYLEYQSLKKSFSDHPNNMTVIERMVEIDDETMRIATILSEREFTIDVPKRDIKGNIGKIQWLEVTYPPSGVAVVRVIDPDMNLNPEKVDDLDVYVWSDSHTKGFVLTATETDVLTGIFEGMLFLTPNHESSGPRLKVAEGDTITAEYEDNTLPVSFTDADVLNVIAKSEIHSTPESPLKQMQSGVKFHNVECKEGLQLVYKKTDDTSACVTIFTEIELVVRGWATDNRVMLGCMGDRVQICYPEDPSQYRNDLYEYYFGDEK